jgi:hypothetical protein
LTPYKKEVVLNEEYSLKYAFCRFVWEAHPKLPELSWEKSPVFV